MRGVDVGSHLDIDGFGLTLAYTDTKGIGADGLYGFNTDGGVGINDAEVNATQWYGEADYVMGKTTLGCSYGEGQQDATVSPVGKARDITNKLGMVFVHHQLTPALTVMGEIQDYRSDAQANYNAYVVGAQFDF
jgi:predicted porin